jgi:competence protein ComGF
LAKAKGGRREVSSWDEIEKGLKVPMMPRIVASLLSEEREGDVSRSVREEEKSERRKSHQPMLIQSPAFFITPTSFSILTSHSKNEARTRAMR